MLVEVLGDDQRDKSERDDEQDPDEHVGLVLERGEEAAGRLRRGGHLVGEALGTHRLGFVVAAAGHAEAARQHGVAGALDDEVGLAGEQRLVDLEVAPAHHVAVDHDLVAGLGADGVADDELGGVDLALIAVAHDDGAGPGQDGDAVERALGAHLLVEADHGVGGHDAHRQQRVEVVTERDEHRGQHEQDVVDEVEDVVAHDLAIRAPGGRRHLVAVAGRAPPRRFGFGQAGPGGGAFDTVSRIGGNGGLLDGAQAIVPSVSRAPAARSRSATVCGGLTLVAV